MFVKVPEGTEVYEDARSSPPKLEDDEEQQDESNQSRNSFSLLRCGYCSYKRLFYKDRLPVKSFS